MWFNKKNICKKTKIKDNKENYKHKGVYFYPEKDLVNTKLCPSIKHNTYLIGNFAGYYGTLDINGLNFDCETSLYECILFKKVLKSKTIIITSDKETVLYMNKIKELLKLGKSQKDKILIDKNFNVISNIIQGKEAEVSFFKNAINIYCMENAELIMNLPYKAANSIYRYILDMGTKGVPTIIDGKEIKAAPKIFKKFNSLVTLGPLNTFQDRKVYEHVLLKNLNTPTSTFEMVDNLFADVKGELSNLNIAVLTYDVTDTTYNDLLNISFNPKAKIFFDMPHTSQSSITHLGNLVEKPGVVFDRDTTFIYLDRTAAHGVHYEGCFDYTYNCTDTPILSIPTRCSGQYEYFFIDCHKSVIKKNLARYWYFDGKQGLNNFLIKSLNKCSGTCELAIPNIDWEIIDTHPLWEKDPNIAVGDSLGFSWNKDLQEIKLKKEHFVYNYNTKMWELTKQ